MRAAEAAAVGLDQLTGEELKEHIGRMRELLHTANTQQDRLNQLAKLARSGSARLGGPGELLHTETQRRPGQHGRRPAPTDPAPQGLAAS